MFWLTSLVNGLVNLRINISNVPVVNLNDFLYIPDNVVTTNALEKEVGDTKGTGTSFTVYYKPATE
jgi:hypothetical protein